MILSMAEVAKAKGCSKWSVLRAIQAKPPKLKATRCGKVWLVDAKSAEAWHPRGYPKGRKAKGSKPSEPPAKDGLEPETKLPPSRFCPTHGFRPFGTAPECGGCP